MDIYEAVPPKTSWWSRNWRWFVPLLLLSNVAILGFVLMIFKSSGAYKVTIETIKTSPIVQEELGTPIEESIYIIGSIETNSDTGQAGLFFGVRGPKDSATVRSSVIKSNGIWELTFLELEIKSTKEKIDLLLYEQ